MGPPKWARLPTWWVGREGLAQFRWSQGEGSDNTAALMALMVIAHHADPQTGCARLTYGDLCEATSISRAKLSQALSVLEGRKLVQRWQDGRSSFQLKGYDPASGWCKLPVRSLYDGPVVEAFTHFRLRVPTELNALKLYLLFAARRGRDTNMANISYDKIIEYTGLRREQIKAGITMLAALSLAYVERVPSAVNAHGVANAYRLAGLESHTHMGTIGRRLTAQEFDRDFG